MPFESSYLCNPANDKKMKEGKMCIKVCVEIWTLVLQSDSRVCQLLGVYLAVYLNHLATP